MPEHKMTVGIVGLGLIGGSLGLDLRSQGHRVVGMSRQSVTCERAIALGAVDAASVEGCELAEADIIFLCTPLSAMLATVKWLIPLIPNQTILTDVGSVKGWVVDAIAPLWPNFVGGHPMAGTAESGIEAAQRDLFVGAAYVLTPTAATPAAAVAAVERVVRPLQTRIYHCAPDAHDRAVAWISHLPVITSASLIAACLQEADPQVLALAQALASSGFRDTSRVGGGNPELGVMMAKYNQAALLQALAGYRDRLDGVIDQIAQDDWTGLTALLAQTQQARPKFVKGETPS
jgi:arogenate dehydrogenase (NADP+)